MTRPPARWAFVAAYAVPLCVLPSALWRVSLLADDAIRLDAEGWYLILLSGGSVALALLTPALVHRWGERFPRWVVVVPAVTGALLLVAISLYAGVNAVFHVVERGPVLVGPSEAPRPEPDGGVALLYLPLLAWGPLVLALAVDHWRRRATPSRPCARSAGPVAAGRSEAPW